MPTSYSPSFFKTTLFFAASFLMLSIPFSPARAQESSTTSATTPPTPLQKAFESVKDGLDTLVDAKDTKTQDDLALRIDIFNKVLTFATTEAKDLKLKLLALDTLDTSLSLWRDETVKKITALLEQYDDEKTSFEKTRAALTLQELKVASEKFRVLRESLFLPLADNAQDFLLIDQESRALQVSAKRFQKISDDVKKLEKAKAKGVLDLQKFLAKAGKLLDEAETLNARASITFKTLHIIPPPIFEISTTTAPLPTSTPSSTYTGEGGESMRATEKNMTVRDMVMQSLQKIKEAYQVFLEMSVFVKKNIK